MSVMQNYLGENHWYLEFSILYPIADLLWLNYIKLDFSFSQKSWLLEIYPVAEHDSSNCSKNIPTQTIRQWDLLINLEPGLKFNDFEGSHSWPVNQRHINFINKILWSPYLSMHQWTPEQQNPWAFLVSGFCNTSPVQLDLCPWL